jgi:hypothetical protein
MASEQGHAAKDAVVVADQLADSETYLKDLYFTQQLEQHGAGKLHGSHLSVHITETSASPKGERVIPTLVGQYALPLKARRLERPFCSLFSACRPAPEQRRSDHHFAEAESPVRLRLAE